MGILTAPNGNEHLNKVHGGQERDIEETLNANNMKKLKQIGFAHDPEDQTYESFERDINKIEKLNENNLKLVANAKILPLRTRYKLLQIIEICNTIDSETLKEYLKGFKSFTDPNHPIDISKIANKESKYSESKIKEINTDISTTKEKMRRLPDKYHTNSLKEALDNYFNSLENSDDEVNDFYIQAITDDRKKGALLQRKINQLRKQKNNICEDLYGSELNYQIAKQMASLGVEIKTQNPKFPQAQDIQEYSEEKKEQKVKDYLSRHRNILEDGNYSIQDVIIKDIMNNYQVLLDNKHDEYIFAIIDLYIKRFQEGKEKNQICFDEGIDGEIINAIKNDKIPLNYFKSFLNLFSKETRLEWEGAFNQVAKFNFTEDTISQFLRRRNGIETFKDFLSYPTEKEKYKKNLQSIKSRFEPEV